MTCVVILDNGALQSESSIAGTSTAHTTKGTATNKHSQSEV
uniref:Uncharacterized protein n=1 Tax=Anguilla anguilla TaxID=7936 RepID=A0A0E9UY61_ANGAN